MNGIALHLDNCLVLPNTKSELMLMRRALSLQYFLVCRSYFSFSRLLMLCVK